MSTKSHTTKIAAASALALAAALSAGPAFAGGAQPYYSGSLYDPETNTTKTLVGGPGGWASAVEPGNTLFRH